MADELGVIVDSIVEEVKNVTHEELAAALSEEISASEILPILKQKINDFLITVELYESEAIVAGYGDTTSKIRMLEYKKEMIYQQFFEIQNLINAFLGQRIVMTYVHIDDEGHREIRISDNDISHLQVTEGKMWNGSPFHKLSYVVDSGYDLLKSSLPEDDKGKLNALQDVSAAVEHRYNTYNKRVLWFYPDSWKGAKFRNKGPINEAFVNMYVHLDEVMMRNSLEGNIDLFMTDSKYGAINADATKGLLIGDVSRDGVQYAVKGAFGSPQGIKDVIKNLKELKASGFSMSAFYSFIKKYTDDELSKNYAPQMKEMTSRSLSAFMRYNQQKLEQDLSFDLTF